MLKIHFSVKQTSICQLHLSIYLKYSYTMISSTRSKLHTRGIVALFLVFPPQSVNSRHMAYKRIKQNRKRGTCWIGETPQFYETTFHSHCKKPMIRLAVDTQPRQCSNATLEHWQSHEQLNRWRSLLQLPYLYSLISWTGGKFMTERVPRARPYYSFMGFLLDNELLAEFVFSCMEKITPWCKYLDKLVYIRCTVQLMYVFKKCICCSTKK